MYYGKLLRQIVDAIRPLGGLPQDLTNIGKKFDEQTKAISAADEREQQEEKVRQEWFKKVFSEYKESERNKSTNENRSHRVQNSLRWATWCTFVAASVYGAVAFWQATISQSAVSVASRTLNETVRSNKAQEAANMASFQATVDNFHQEQRAWVGIVSMEPPSLKPRSDFFLSLHAMNSGHTPALNFQSLVVLHSSKKGEPFKALYSRLPDEVRSNRVVQPGEQVTLNTIQYPITQDQADSVRNGSQILYVYGKMSYDDIFHAHHRTTFCKLVLSESLVEDCGTYNTAD
jgi:hypothetical protein